MNGKKKLLAITLSIVIVLSAAGGIGWIFHNNYLIDFHLYPKDAKTLDLRGHNISPKHYQKLLDKLPECNILWDVPFQGKTLSCDVTEITVKELSEADAAALTYLLRLETVHAEDCTDYENLLLLKKYRPKVTVEYQVTVGGQAYPNTADTVELNRISQQELALLPYLPELDTVILTGAVENPSELKAYCEEKDIDLLVRIGDQLLEQDTESLTVENITDEELDALANLPFLKNLHLTNPDTQPESLLELDTRYPNINATWEVEIAGEVFDSTETVVDLSTIVIRDLAEVEKRMAYLPDVETVIFGLCGKDNPEWGNSKAKDIAACPIENEDMAAYRDRVRDQYKVVWTVRLGPSIALRTDKDNFMPNHFGVGRLFNDYAYNLRYCEDMVCLDVGHMTLNDISFVSYMPKLKYLILAWTEVQYIEPIRSCKNLVWLELDNSCIRDYSPLVDCTALEDLNIGRTYCDITPILEMTWLKNLYMIFGSSGDAWKAAQALPDTHVVSSGNATVGGGWRQLPNYYDMRDCLNMYYMN